MSIDEADVEGHGRLFVVALSGGWDSTAMALRLAELGHHVDHYLITPTGDELPEMVAHWERLECLLGKSFTRPKAPTLRELIESYNALPNNRMRWCTRQIKIRPCLDWIRMQKPERVQLAVGLRADEPERRGIYSDDVDTVFPLREWGWSRSNVVDYVRSRGIEVPLRTDCARCYGQRIGEWYRLWRDHPDLYADAEEQERRTNHTFRSPARDTWPTSLSDLRAEFERGRVPPGGRVQLSIFAAVDNGACRVCSL